MDHLDNAIIQTLTNTGRASLAEVGKRTGISGPAVGERLRKLQDSGVIAGFTAQLHLPALGYTLQALVRIKPRAGQLKRVEQLIINQPRFTACDRVTGEDCFVARLAIKEISELDEVLNTLHDLAETHTSIIKSSLFEPRLPPVLPKAR